MNPIIFLCFFLHLEVLQLWHQFFVLFFTYVTSNIDCFIDKSFYILLSLKQHVKCFYFLRVDDETIFQYFILHTSI